MLFLTKIWMQLDTKPINLPAALMGLLGPSSFSSITLPYILHAKRQFLLE